MTIYRQKFFNSYLKYFNISTLTEFLNLKTSTTQKLNKDNLISQIKDVKLHLESLKEFEDNNEISKFNNKLALQLVHPNMRLSSEVNKLMNALLTALKNKYLKIGIAVLPNQLSASFKKEQQYLTIYNPKLLKSLNNDKTLYQLMNFISKELMDFSGCMAEENKKNTIAPIHLEFVLTSDEEFTELVNKILN